MKSYFLAFFTRRVALVQSSVDNVFVEDFTNRWDIAENAPTDIHPITSVARVAPVSAPYQTQRLIILDIFT